jgi:hypothetical protein
MRSGPTSVTTRQPGCDTRFGSRRPAKSKGLALLFDALSGTGAVTRMFDRDPSTVAKWRTSTLPLPAEIAAALRAEVIRIARSLLLAEAQRLEEEISAAERRAADGLARRRRAFLRLLNAGR